MRADKAVPAIALACVCVGTLIFTCSTAAAKQHGITASAAILVDGTTGNTLWSRNPDLRLPPASTTKVLTALLAIKSNRLSESFQVSALAAEAPPSKIRLRRGWKVALGDLIYAMLLNSANDASVVAAEGLAGSLAEFSAWMNAEARTLGAVNSHFVNPHGLPAKNHYSTVRDLTTIFAEGLDLPLFRQALSTKHTAIVPTRGANRTIALRSHNRLLMSDYPVRVIGKTGWTKAAKRCFVGAATVGDRELLLAVLGSRDLWGDIKQLLEKGSRITTDIPAPVDPGLAAGEATAAGAVEPDDAPRRPRYEVHIPSLRGIEAADRLRRVIVRRGYEAKVRPIRKGGGIHYQIVVGDYGSFREAQKVAQRLGRLERVTPIVAKVGI